MQKCSKILKDGWIDGLMIGRKFLLLLCALRCRRARAAECIFAPVVNYLIFIRNVAAEPSGGRQQDRLKCSDLHIHVPRGPFDIFFSPSDQASSSKPKLSSSVCGVMKVARFRT